VIAVSQRASLTISAGFGSRKWLTVDEWMTYRRRVAVRYPQKARKFVSNRDGEKCCICGMKGTLQRPIQLAHRVPFKIGVIDWGLCPDWLDSVSNLCLAHRGACNDNAEIKESDIPAWLCKLGLDLNDSPAIYTGALTINESSLITTLNFKN
jgi:hypothetical protein